jgi:hypothetical protein
MEQSTAIIIGQINLLGNKLLILWCEIHQRGNQAWWGVGPHVYDEISASPGVAPELVTGSGNLKKIEYDTYA